MRLHIYIHCRCHGQVESNVRELMGNMVKTEQEVINMSVVFLVFFGAKYAVYVR